MLIGLALALSLVGCGNVAEPVAPRTKPSDLIPDAEFTQLLLEMHLIEGARGGEHLMGDSIPVWEVYGGTLPASDTRPTKWRAATTSTTLTLREWWCATKSLWTA